MYYHINIMKVTNYGTTNILHCNHVQREKNGYKRKCKQLNDEYKMKLNQLIAESQTKDNKYVKLQMEYVTNDKIWNKKYRLLHDQLQQTNMLYNNVHNENVNTLNKMHTMLSEKDHVMKQMDNIEQNLLKQLTNKYQVVSSHCIDMGKQLKQMQTDYNVLMSETLRDYNNISTMIKYHQQNILWKQP
eukprot:79351_1